MDLGPRAATNKQLNIYTIPALNSQTGCVAVLSVLVLELQTKVREDFTITEKAWIGHSINFPRGVVHRVENGWGLTKVAVVLLNGLLW